MYGEGYNQALEDVETALLSLPSVEPDKVITFDKSALKDICEMLNVPYDEDIIGFTKYGVIKKPSVEGATEEEIFEVMMNAPQRKIRINNGDTILGNDLHAMAHALALLGKIPTTQKGDL